MTASAEEGARIAAAAHRVSSESDYGPLLEVIGDRQVVLIGEASHGTHDFYATRADLTRRLIDEKGFRSLALEADWPDALRVHRYVQGTGGDANADAGLSGFNSSPQWMWRTTAVL